MSISVTIQIEYKVMYPPFLTIVINSFTGTYDTALDPSGSNV